MSFDGGLLTVIQELEEKINLLHPSALVKKFLLLLLIADDNRYYYFCERLFDTCPCCFNIVSGGSNQDSVGRRVAALTSELERTIKLQKRAHNSTSSSSSSSSSSTTLDAARVQQITQLYSLVESLSSFEAELPIIVERLETLQALHCETATFSQRLTSMEESVSLAREETSAHAEVCGFLLFFCFILFFDNFVVVVVVATLT